MSCVVTEEEIAATKEVGNDDEEKSAPKVDLPSLLCGEGHKGDGSNREMSSSPGNILMAAIDIYIEPSEKV